VYFPHGSIDDSEVYALEDLGREAVKSIFTTMVKSISNVNNNMQIRQYIDVQGINEVCVWRNGEKLISLQWIGEKYNK